MAEVATLLGLLDPALQVVLLTARPGRVQPQTVAWLARYGLRWDLLIMRDWGDYSAAREFKQYSVYELRQFGFDLRLAFEDDRRNLAMFHRGAFPVCTSTPGTSTDRSCWGFPCVHGCVRDNSLPGSALTESREARVWEESSAR